MSRWSKPDRVLEIAHVENNKNNVSSKLWLLFARGQKAFDQTW